MRWVRTQIQGAPIKQSAGTPVSGVVYELLHVYGDNPCGGRLFRTRREPISREPVRTEDIILADGSSPDVGDRVICESCGQAPLGRWCIVSTDSVREVSADG